MTGQNKISFSLLKLLVVPIIFAVFFALIPYREAAGYVFIAATGSSILLFLINLDNLPSIITSALGCLLGGSMGMPVIHSSKGPRPTMDRKLFEITIGVILGYLFIKLLEWIIGVWVRSMDQGNTMAGETQELQKKNDAKQSEMN